MQHVTEEPPHAGHGHDGGDDCGEQRQHILGRPAAHGPAGGPGYDGEDEQTGRRSGGKAGGRMRGSTTGALAYPAARAGPP